jgi:aminoglycoside 6'-N-acetyltransferase
VQTTLSGALVALRPAAAADIPVLADIRATPEVYERWRGGDDLAKAVAEDLRDPDIHLLVVRYGGRVVGAIQWGEEADPDYRHANIDIFLSPKVYGRGLCTDAVRTLARHLFVDRGHHRIVIDPATDNAAAIACYGKVGFHPVGVMRRYERGPDGDWHDGLLMELLVDDLTAAGRP